MAYLGHYFMPPASFQSVLEEDKEVTIAPSTKLACTLGPESRDVATLEQLLKAGMSIARFDFSYGDVAYHQKTLDNLHVAMANTRRLCATMIDTVGPEIFVINKSGKPIEITAGQTIMLTADQTQTASNEVLVVNLPLEAGIQPGQAIFVGQYLFTGSETSSVYLTVQQVDGDKLVCTCENACRLEGHLLTAHFANTKNSAPILTEEDKVAITTFGVINSVDFISLAFTRTEQDVLDCRAVLDGCGLKQTQIMGKIENREGLANLAAILAASDAIILSRGNLGICLDAEKMFLCQKIVLRTCNLAGKPIFVTRVVDTMTDAPRPTRAEATDVANLVLDGADGILLGSETFRGRYPVETSKTVMAICKQAESCFDTEAFYRTAMDFQGVDGGDNALMGKTDALASSAVRAAAKINAKLLVVFTVSGRTARMVAKYKPSQPILTVVCTDSASAEGHNNDTFSRHTSGDHSKAAAVPSISEDPAEWNWTGDFAARQCLCLRGVLPLMVDPSMGTPGGAILDYAIAFARHKGLVTTGDRVVVMQCPRKVQNPVMEEGGIVKLITIDDEACGAVPAGRLVKRNLTPLKRTGDAQDRPVYMIGSTDNLAALAKNGSL